MNTDDNEPPVQSSCDLMWVANSPSLLAFSGEMTSTGTQNEPFSVASDQLSLTQSEIDAGRLQGFLAKNPHNTVGRYFESLVYYWIKYVRGLEVLVCNEQIKRSGRTVGEIDLVFRNEQYRLVHWETAVKFFLHLPQPHSFSSDYVGPNSRDNLDKKMNHLFGHQLKQSLDGLINVDFHEAFVRGCIFYHPSNAFIIFLGNDPEEDRFRLLAEYLDAYSKIKPNATVELQKPFVKPTRVTRAHAVSESEPNPTPLFTINWALPSPTNA